MIQGPNLGPCLRALCGELHETMEAALAGHRRFSDAWFLARPYEVTLVSQMPGTRPGAFASVGSYSARLWRTSSVQEAAEILEAHDVVPGGWSSDQRRRWEYEAGATHTNPRDVPDLVSVASLDWARAEALGRECARLLTSAAQCVVWRVCDERGAGDGVALWQFGALRDRARACGMSAAPCDALLALGVMFVGLDAQTITLAAPHLGLEFLATKAWRELERGRRPAA